MSELSIVKKGKQYLLEGPLDTSADFSPIEEGADELHLNLEGLTAVNSMGIRNWVQWVGELSDKTTVYLHHCPRFMVEQFSTVWSLLKKNIIVQSFYVPYYCEDLDEVYQVLYKRGVDFDGNKVNIKKQIKAGPTKERIAELDVFEKKYFKFILESEDS